MASLVHLRAQPVPTKPVRSKNSRLCGSTAATIRHILRRAWMPPPRSHAKKPTRELNCPHPWRSREKIHRPIMPCRAPRMTSAHVVDAVGRRARLALPLSSPPDGSSQRRPPSAAAAYHESRSSTSACSRSGVHRGGMPPGTPVKSGRHHAAAHRVQRLGARGRGRTPRSPASDSRVDHHRAAERLQHHLARAAGSGPKPAPDRHPTSPGPIPAPGTPSTSRGGRARCGLVVDVGVASAAVLAADDDRAALPAERCWPCSARDGRPA